MRLIVDHTTRYIYAQPMRSLVQSHRLTPSLCEAQTVIDWQVSVSEGQRGASFRDGAGDAIQGWSIAGPIEVVSVRVQGRVETRDTAGVLRGNRELVHPEVYLSASSLTASTAALTELAQGVTAEDQLALAHGLCDAVSAAIAYRPGATHAQTTADEALALAEGVCQDHAHVLIACARARGIPGRYVSGYLFTQGGEATGATGAPEVAEAPEAAHAWAELHLPGLGWVGFDPANGCCPDERYIRLGSGFDALDAAPIRGVARGLARETGGETLEVSVAVRAAEQ